MTAKDRADLLFEEYRALYGLLEFRMLAMDQRIPMAAALFAALIGVAPVMPAATGLLSLLILPMAVVWLLRTTAMHARSKEDLLRRIEDVERHINTLAAEELLVFQSRHPSRHLAIGGRTGQETLRAVLCASLVMLGACGLQFWLTVDALEWQLGLYGVYLFGVGAHIVLCVRALARYRYDDLGRRAHRLTPAP
jgi:hypothetical protein